MHTFHFESNVFVLLYVVTLTVTLNIFPQLSLCSPNHITVREKLGRIPITWFSIGALHAFGKSAKRSSIKLEDLIRS